MKVRFETGGTQGRVHIHPQKHAGAVEVGRQKRDHNRDRTGRSNGMRKVINVLTVVALLSVMLGISMIDSENTLIPVLVMTPGSVWLTLRVLITEVFK